MRTLFLALALASLAACAKPADEPVAETQGAVGLDRSKAGTMAPDLAFRDPDGEETTLAAFRGRPVLLNLWATWCAPCVKELPTLDALAAKSGEKIEVVTLSQDMGEQQRVEDFLRAKGLDALEAWQDPDMAMTDATGAPTIPTTILYDSSGREVWRWVGDADWTSAETAALLVEAR